MFFIKAFSVVWATFLFVSLSFADATGHPRLDGVGKASEVLSEMNKFAKGNNPVEFCHSSKVFEESMGIFATPLALMDEQQNADFGKIGRFYEKIGQLEVLVDLAHDLCSSHQDGPKLEDFLAEYAKFEGHFNIFEHLKIKPVFVEQLIEKNPKKLKEILLELDKFAKGNNLVEFCHSSKVFEESMSIYATPLALKDRQHNGDFGKIGRIYERIGQLEMLIDLTHNLCSIHQVGPNFEDFLTEFAKFGGHFEVFEHLKLKPILEEQLSENVSQLEELKKLIETSLGEEIPGDRSRNQLKEEFVDTVNNVALRRVNIKKPKEILTEMDKCAKENNLLEFCHSSEVFEESMSIYATPLTLKYDHHLKDFGRAPHKDFGKIGRFYEKIGQLEVLVDLAHNLCAGQQVGLKLEDFLAEYAKFGGHFEVFEYLKLKQIEKHHRVFTRKT